MRITALVTMVCLLLAGCASIYHGTTDTVYMHSEVQGTDFYLDDKQVGKGTMAIVTLPKKELKGRVLRAGKPGCKDNVSPLLTGFDGLTMLGCFLDYCVISVLLVDWIINGATTHVIQNQYILTPDCSADLAPEQAPRQAP